MIEILRPSSWLIIRLFVSNITKTEKMCLTDCKDFYEVSVVADELKCDRTCGPYQEKLLAHWRGDPGHRDFLSDQLEMKGMIFSDSFYTKNQEWFIDGDKMVGIQKLSYPDTVQGMTNQELDAIRKYTFVIWQGDFKETSDNLTGRLINKKDDLYDLLNNGRNLTHQALLRRKRSAPLNPSIEDDFDCLFLQGNIRDNDSSECHDEKNDSGGQNCEYWQTCEFTAVKAQDCNVVASKVVALVIPIVILLLTTAIFAIYCFKKKADKADATNKEIVDRLPDMSGGQVSTRSNRGSRLPSTKMDNHEGLNTSAIYRDATPGIQEAIKKNSILDKKPYKKPNNVLDGVNEEGSNFSQFPGQSNQSFDMEETYNNSQATGYHNSIAGYNNSMLTSNDNEKIEVGRAVSSKRHASYLPHH